MGGIYYLTRMFSFSWSAQLRTRLILQIKEIEFYVVVPEGSGEGPSTSIRQLAGG